MTTVSTLLVASPPWADFAFAALPAGTVSCRILRKDAGAWTVLPGASARPVLGAEWRFIDHGLPVRESATAIDYRLEPLSDAGAILSAGVLEWSVTSPVVGHSGGWLSDPLDPLAGVPVTVLDPSGNRGDVWSGGSSLLRPMSGDPVSLGARRARSRGWRVRTQTAAQAAAVWQMVDRGGVLLLRADPSCVDHRTGVVYLHVDEPSASATLTHQEVRRWSLAGTECRPPAILQVVASRTYADDLAEHPTYADSTAAFDTYLDRVRG